MLASQVVLLLFISEWIRVQYRDEERRLNDDLKNIFVNTEERLSDSLLNQTVAVILKSPGRQTIPGMEVKVTAGTNEPLKNINDSIVKTIVFPTVGDSVREINTHVKPFSGQKNEQVIIRNLPKETQLPENMKKVLRVALVQTANAQGVSEHVFTSSINDDLMIKEYSNALEKKKYSFKTQKDTLPQEHGTLFSYRQNAPEGLAVKVSGYEGHLFKSITPQIIFSLLLLLLTGIAFGLAYRNMKKQALFSEQKDSMISNISHELKTPVATTKVALEALSSFNGIDDPIRTRKYLQVAEWEINRLENMIERVMNIMQTETANIILHKESVNLWELLSEITNALKSVISEKSVTLDMEQIDKHLLVVADKIHLTGTIYNILDNAIKYGGNAIEIKLLTKGDEAVLEIKDNGPGISPSYHKKVFEHFFRVPSGNKHDVKGHGLGLSYARQIIEAHDGKIRLESAPGKGATFIITLPQSPAS